MKEDPPTDSRSYGHARKSPRAAGPGDGHGAPSGPPASDPVTSNGTGHGRHDSGGYPAGSYASPGYAYPAEPTPAPEAQWYSAPPADPAPAPAYGNPYSSYSGTGQASPAPGDANYSSYLADPLRVYSPPPYESPVSAYPDPSGTAYPALPATGSAYPEAYPEHLYGPGQGQPDPPQYPDSSGGTGYAPRYENGHHGDPYAGGGYGAYPSEG